jgi:protein-tyrosine phosphatase
VAKAWAAQGITDVFVLLTDGEQFYYYEELLENVYKPFLKTHNFPVMDMKAMRLSLAFPLVRRAYRILTDSEAGGKILIHCSAGIGRTNMALGCLSEYLKYRGLIQRLEYGSPQTAMQALCIRAFKTALFSASFGRHEL